MNLTLLLDLDDTLLENDIYKFLPHYLKALGRHLSDYVAPEHMAKELLAATDAMIANTQAMRTLEETFDEKFYPALGLVKEQVFRSVTDFYENVFPSLSSLTRPKPAAVRLVDHALRLGHTVIIATNPLFPARAIQHRLAWANLPLTKYSFSIISSFESFHFAKPNPAFAAECLAQLGWVNQPAAIIGNSLSEDLAPAAQLGLPGFLVSSSDSSNPPVKLAPPSRQGTLDEAIDWLDEITLTLSPPDYNTPSAILAVLRTTPAVLDTFGRALQPQCWNEPPHPGEWCFTEIICHLRDADSEINLPRFERILTEDNAFVAAVNADAWSQTRSYCQESGIEALSGFNSFRSRLIQLLENLSPAQWEIPASHAIFGPTTLRELAAFLAQHDRTHIQQARLAVLAAKKAATT